MSDDLNDHWHETDSQIRREMAFPLLLAAGCLGGAFLAWFLINAAGF